MTANMEIADPYYRDGDKVVRAKVVELLDNSPFIRKANTLAELAKKWASMRPRSSATVERYNKPASNGSRPSRSSASRCKSSKAFDTPPTTRCRCSRWRARIRRRQDRPAVPRARQALRTDRRALCRGEVAGMAGGHINGRAGLEGTMLGPSIFSGRVAGGWAAQEAGHGCGFVGKPTGFEWRSSRVSYLFRTKEWMTVAEVPDARLGRRTCRRRTRSTALRPRPYP